MGERWDRDRFMYERSREQDRFDDERSYMRGGRDGREGRDDRDRLDDRQDRRFNRNFDDDDMVRDRRYYGEDRPMPRREAPEQDYPRRGVMEREREREAPPRRPGFLRRQSSLDTFDRLPSRIFHKHEELPPPARREDIRRDDYRAPAYIPIPLPKSRGLPPPRRYPDQGFYDDIKVAEPDYYGDDDFRAYPDRIREREYTRTRTRRERSRERSRDSLSTRTRSHRSSSVSSSTSSRSSSSSGGTTVRSEYPKKGKTRIPSKLVSKRALIDLGYPFFEEGNTIIVQKALGQDNIDELLKVSEDYKKVELDILAARAPVAALPPPPPPVKAPAPAPPPVVVPAPAPAPAPPAPPAERREPAPPPAPKDKAAPPPPAPVVVAMPPPAPAGPVVIDARPPVDIDFIDDSTTTYTRDTSPSRSSDTSSWDTRSHHHRHRSRRRRKSVGPLAIYERSRSRSRSGHELRAEIRALERELAHRPKGSSNREIVRAERLSDGQLVIYEEKLEKVVEHHKPPRIEKDKKGRMSISVPKYR